jgi:hypothetical protein
MTGIEGWEAAVLLLILNGAGVIFYLASSRQAKKRD